MVIFEREEWVLVYFPFFSIFSFFKKINKESYYWCRNTNMQEAHRENNPLQSGEET